MDMTRDEYKALQPLTNSHGTYAPIELVAALASLLGNGVPDAAAVDRSVDGDQTWWRACWLKGDRIAVVEASADVAAWDGMTSRQVDPRVSGYVLSVSEITKVRVVDVQRIIENNSFAQDVRWRQIIRIGEGQEQFSLPLFEDESSPEAREIADAFARRLLDLLHEDAGRTLPGA